MASSIEERRLADVALRSVWGTSVDRITTGLTPAVADELISAFAGVGKALEADPPGAMERVRAAFAAAGSGGFPRRFQLPTTSTRSRGLEALTRAFQKPRRRAMDVWLIIAGMVTTLVGVVMTSGPSWFWGGLAWPLGLAVALLGLLIYLRRRGKTGIPIPWWQVLLGYIAVKALIRLYTGR
jgi:hypothetical protein